MLIMIEAGSKHLKRKIALARAAIAFERVWAALLWPLVIACAGLAAIFSGVLPNLPEVVRLGVPSGHGSGISLFAEGSFPGRLAEPV